MEQAVVRPKSKHNKLRIFPTSNFFQLPAVTVWLINLNQFSGVSGFSGNRFPGTLTSGARGEGYVRVLLN